MKTSNKWLSLLALLFLTVVTHAQTKELAYIRIQERFAGVAYESYMHITLPDQTAKRVDLDKIGYGGSGAEQNGKKIQQELTLLLNQGFSIATSSTGSNEGTTTTTILLTREKK